MRTRLALLLLAIAAVGCNKNIFFASAPAKPGWVYVVGSKNDKAQAWLCPAAPNQGGRCHEIEIEESDR
jgi:hypothetical protein